MGFAAAGISSSRASAAWHVVDASTMTAVNAASDDFIRRIKMMTDSNKSRLEQLTTEARNPLTHDLDNLSALELVKLINSEDRKIAAAVEKVAGPIAEAIDRIAAAFSRGGRLIYVGAGTSGRLGVLDAVECPPTFNTDPDMVVGVMAGGAEGLVRAIEGAEDSRSLGQSDLQDLDLNRCDVVVGIAASGRTPYVLGALEYARQAGAFTIGFSCNQEAEIQQYADLNIIPLVGPEILSGSTRLKAGTATKMVLNMLTTGAMVRIGKTFSNLMVDVRATNTKLIERAIRIIAEVTGCDTSDSRALLNRCNGEVKTAIVSYKNAVSPDEARSQLDSVDGHLRRALELNVS